MGVQLILIQQGGGGRLCPPHYCLPTRIWKLNGISGQGTKNTTLLYSSIWILSGGFANLRLIEINHSIDEPKKKNTCDLSFKGQLILKCLFGIFNSPKKLTKKFDFTTMVPQVELFSFVFWENWRHQKNYFEINWPLAHEIRKVDTALLRSGTQKQGKKMFVQHCSKIQTLFLKNSYGGFHWNGHLDFRDSSDQRFRTYYWNCSADLCYGRLKFCFYHPGLISFSLQPLIFMRSHRLETQRELGS